MSTNDNTLAYSGWKGGEAVAVLDVCFEVEGADGKPVRFFANRSILEAIAPSLAALFGSGDENIATATITDVDPATFRCLLFDVVHGGDIKEEGLRLMAHSIIDAAEKYGVAHLLDEFFVRTTQFTMDNVLGALIFANVHNLASMSKRAVDFIQGNKEKFRKVKLSPSWKCDSCPETFDNFNDMNIHEIKCKPSQEGNGLPAPSVPLATAAAAMVASLAVNDDDGSSLESKVAEEKEEGVGGFKFGVTSSATTGTTSGFTFAAPTSTSAESSATNCDGSAPSFGQHAAAPTLPFGAPTTPALQFGPAPPAPAGGPRGLFGAPASN